LEDAAFFRQLRAEFESLDPSVDSVAHFRGDEFTIEQKGSFYSRFRSFAMRGGAAVSGVTGDAAQAAWLMLLRDRVPHRVINHLSSTIDRRPISISLIDPDPDRPAEPDEPPPALFVRQSGERFVVIRGRGLFNDARNEGRVTIDCDVKVELVDGWIVGLREASMELCEQLESAAFAMSATTVQQSVLGKRLTALRREAGWSLEDMAAKVGVAKSTLVEASHGRTRLHNRNLQAIADAFTKQLNRPVTVRDLTGS
jgi:DNA-binding XRE family transcriptional regulator